MGQFTPAVSLVLPIYNEADTLGPVISHTVETLRAEGLSFEIVAVDDGSSDASFERLRALQSQYPGLLRIARHLLNRGNGAALRTGIRCARGEVVVCMDADGQHSAADIPRMLALIPPYDMVVGQRTAKYQGSWYRNSANKFYNRFASWLTGFPVLDLTSGFRAMRRAAVLHFLPLYPAGFSAPTTVTMSFLKAGYNVTFLPVDVQQRSGGKSKIRLWEDGSRFVTIMLRMIMLYDPQRIFIPASLASAVVGTLVMLAGIWREGRFLVSNAAILFFAAAIFIFLMGLIAGQIASSRVYYFGDETIGLFEDDLSLVEGTAAPTPPVPDGERPLRGGRPSQ